MSGFLTLTSSQVRHQLINDLLFRVVGQNALQWICGMHHSLARWALVILSKMDDQAAFANCKIFLKQSRYFLAKKKYV